MNRLSELDAKDSLKIHQQLHCAYLKKALGEKLFVLSTYTSTTNNEPGRCYHYFLTKVQQTVVIFQM